ncbi:unnamed protein product [Durusdinium trenchii]|uniref:Uncharacterized protein n=1 Tax=Durusdinium trenchii TaxID=1381693 RepID=A0ABP0LIG1_9DINO
MPAKQKSSGGGEGGGKSQKTLPLPTIPADSKDLPHIHQFEEWDVQRSLSMVIMHVGMQTDANQPGTEKLVVAEASETSAASLASTYQVGKLEAGACANLLQKITPAVREELKELVDASHCGHDSLAAACRGNRKKLGWCEKLGLFGLFSGHKVNEFCKSKAALGSITAVDRSRVSELQNPEEDKPLAAHWRAL